jgi:hypothetical protein
MTDFYIEACPEERCRRGVIWARSKFGVMTPVDAAPNPAGRLRVFETQGVVQVRMVSDAEAERMRKDPLAEPLRTGHRDTCDARLSWREKRALKP